MEKQEEMRRKKNDRPLAATVGLWAKNISIHLLVIGILIGMGFLVSFLIDEYYVEVHDCRLNNWPRVYFFVYDRMEKMI